VCLVCEQSGDRRIERVTRSLPNDSCCVFLATPQPLEGGITGYVGDPQGQRNLISNRPAKWAFAVPALGEVDERFCTDAGSPSRSVSMCATSQSAARCGLFPLAALGSRRAIWAARTGAARAGSGSARMSPATISRCDPNMTGTKCVAAPPPKSSAAISASAVQPE
jgi:hypothetical protein